MWPDARRAERRRRSILAAVAVIAALIVIRLWLSASVLPIRRATLVSVAVLFGVLLLSAAVGFKLFDLGGRREERAARVQNRVSERLREALGHVPITVVAYALPSRRSPLVIEVTGPVPSEARRDTILAVVRREAAALGRDVRVADRLEVQPLSARRAA